METPITPPSLRADFLAKLRDALPPVPVVPDGCTEREIFDDYDYALDQRSHQQYVAVLGALVVCPTAIELPYVALCMVSGRYDEALTAIAAHADAPAPLRTASGPVRLQLIPDPLRPEWSWEIYTPEMPVAVSARPFSTPREALDDATDWAEGHGLAVASAPVQVHLPRRSVGVPARAA